MLRSAEKSSTGISRTESSIYKAYLKCIEEAKDFIYIEVRLKQSKTLVCAMYFASESVFCVDCEERC